jgi:hypothetical protein
MQEEELKSAASTSRSAIVCAADIVRLLTENVHSQFKDPAPLWRAVAQGVELGEFGDGERTVLLSAPRSRCTYICRVSLLLLKRNFSDTCLQV